MQESYNILAIENELDLAHGLPCTYNDFLQYEKIYGVGADIKYDDIHGKADRNNLMAYNNMVLGLDEYLDDI